MVREKVTLNPEQARAVVHGAGPLMVLAGAGSGKTRVLVHRIENLVEGGGRPDRILAVTFTNKAAGEMRGRLWSLLGPIAGAMWIGTFHSTCAKLLRRYYDAAGLGPDFTIFDDDDQVRLVGQLLKDEGLNDVVTPRTVLSSIDRCKNRGVDPVTLDNGAYADDIVRKIYPLYRDRLQRENAVDFNDLLLKVLALAEGPSMKAEMASLFDYVLVDEFQDTNLIQYRLVRHMVARTQNLTVVGDDDQSIYAWRGAEPRNLLDFDRDFPEAVVVKLEQNYRSSQVILEAANAVISENLDRHEKKLWTEREGGEPILWEETGDERMEADFIAGALRGLHEEEGRDYPGMAVLYRTHAQSRVLEERLRRYGIDYRIVGGVSFFQRREVKDIRAYLRLVCNPAADSCFERIVNVPARGIGKTTVERVRAHARLASISMLDAAKNCVSGAVAAVKPAARKKLAAFVDIIEGLQEVEAAGASVAELIIQTVERSGYRERLEAEDTQEAQDRLGNLSELVSMASDFDDENPDGRGKLIEFEEKISLESANDGAHGEQGQVTLMTMHAAKGLEFPVVFVCGMEDGLFPSLREDSLSDERKRLEEERRLCYVAFTRAMDRLILTSAQVRRQWGEIRITRPSRFIDSVPEGCLAVRERPVPVQRDYGEMPSSLRRKQRQAPEYDEFDQSSGFDDDVPVFEPEYGDSGGNGSFFAGTSVQHEQFGVGRVIEVRGSGSDSKLLIQFSSFGLKTVLARFVQPA